MLARVPRELLRLGLSCVVGQTVMVIELRSEWEKTKGPASPGPSVLALEGTSSALILPAATNQRRPTETDEASREERHRSRLRNGAAGLAERAFRSRIVGSLVALEGATRAFPFLAAEREEDVALAARKGPGDVECQRDRLVESQAVRDAAPLALTAASDAQQGAARRTGIEQPEVGAILPGLPPLVCGVGASVRAVAVEVPRKKNPNEVSV